MSPTTTRTHPHPKQSAGTARTHRGLIWTASVGAITLIVALPATAQAAPLGAAGSGAGHDDDAFTQTNLVSDVPGLAALTDPVVTNPWGIDAGPATPLWVSNNNNFPTDPASLVKAITLYRGANGKDKIAKVPLEVNASGPTGMVFNPTDSFVVSRDGKSAPSRFIWEEVTVVPPDVETPIGEITGWSPEVPPVTDGVIKVTKPSAFHAGLALVTTEEGPRLLVADSQNGVIDVYDGKFRKVEEPGAFVDPDAVAADGTVILAPYNVAVLRGRVYVAYTNNSGVGPEALSVFTKRGKFIKRLVSGAPLVGPWGMTIAPEDWGDFGGDLLVGNVGDGIINAFDRRSGKFAGSINGADGKPLVNEGLWGLRFGNGVIGTPRTLLFSAGIGKEIGNEVYEHGLIGIISPADDD